MSKQISLNVAVADLPKSTAFFNTPGISRNPQLTVDTIKS
jgi:predicted lactoylglutathione lyase